MHRIVFCAILVREDLRIQEVLLMYTNFILVVYLYSVSQLFLDKHLQVFELTNQLFIVSTQFLLFAFTDLITDHRFLYDFGFFFCFYLMAFFALQIFIIFLYSSEPVFRGLRLRRMRKIQVLMAIEVRDQIVELQR